MSYINQTKDALSDGQFDNALSLLNKAIVSNPNWFFSSGFFLQEIDSNDATVRVLMSNYYKKIEKYDLMLKEALKAHELDSNLLEARILLAEALVETGKKEELSYTKIKEGINYLNSSLKICTDAEV